MEKYQLHNGQPQLLHLLKKGDGIPHTTIAKELMITPATASTMVKRMEKVGFVIRKRDAVDERVSNVYLTDSGRELNVLLEGYQKQMNEMVFNDFSDDERAVMRSFLERILENLK